MRVAVIGAGGVGGYLAHRLIAGGAEVAVLARGAHLDAIRAQGLTLIEHDGTEEAQRPAIATDRGAEIGPADLAIFAVKGQDLGGAIAEAREIVVGECMALSLLNGVEGPGMLAHAFGRDRALAGIARISAFIEAPGRVAKVTEFAGFTIGDMDGRQDRAPVPTIRALFHAAGIRAPDCADVTAELWLKCVQLTALAGVTAGGRCDIATARAVPELRALMQRLIAETIAVAAARGIALPEDTAARTMHSLDRLPGQMRASLAHDLAAGKPLETDWLNGAVARLGAKAGVATPAHETVAALLAPYRDGAARE